MTVRVNEKGKFGYRTIELFDKASSRYAEITIEPDGTVHESGDPTLIKIFKTKKLNYTSISDYRSKRDWMHKTKNNQEQSNYITKPLHIMESSQLRHQWRQIAHLLEQFKTKKLNYK